MTPKLTPDQQHAIKYLVEMRHAARRIIIGERSIERLIETTQDLIDSAKNSHDGESEAIFVNHMASVREHQLQARFHTIEIGNHLVGISSHFDDIPREHWLRALSVNESEWHTESMQKYGKSVLNVVSVLDLENSATVDDSILVKPLKWCCTMAMMNATKTNAELGKLMHDKCNEILGGVFGEWKEPSVLERLGVAN